MSELKIPKTQKEICQCINRAEELSKITPFPIILIIPEDFTEFQKLYSQYDFKIEDIGPLMMFVEQGPIHLVYLFKSLKLIKEKKEKIK